MSSVSRKGVTLCEYLSAIEYVVKNCGEKRQYRAVWQPGSRAGEIDFIPSFGPRFIWADIEIDFIPSFGLILTQHFFRAFETGWHESAREKHEKHDHSLRKWQSLGVIDNSFCHCHHPSNICMMMLGAVVTEPETVTK